MLASHSAESAQWFTPPQYTQAIREILGTIDLDPCSCEEANKLVQAAKYYDANGLSRPWHGNVYVNPPGGRGVDPPIDWWRRTVLHTRRTGASAVFCIFNLNQLQSFQRTDPHPLHYTICFPRKRVKYWRSHGPGKSPPHASAFVYIPSFDKRGRAMFESVMTRFGHVVHGDHS